MLTKRNILIALFAAIGLAIYYGQWIVWLWPR
jgi:hypothetical protein